MRELSLLKRLVSLNTDATKRLNYKEAAELIASEAESAGMAARIVGKEVPNVVARLDVGARMDLAIVSHYDVIPAPGPWRLDDRELDPFEPTEVDGKLYGRGAADDKSAVVASLAAVDEVRGQELRYNPLVIVTGDEEVGGIGVREVVDAGITGDRALIVDSAIDYVGVGASGVVHGWLKVMGRGGHAGYPHQARNPVTGLASLISEMTRFAERRASVLSQLDSPVGSPISKLWGRFNFTMLQGGIKHNVIPDEARAGFDMRLVPDEDPTRCLDELRAQVEVLRERLGLEVELEISEPMNEGWMTELSHPLVQEALDAFERVFGRRLACGELGGNDGYYFSRRGVPTVAFGAMRDENNVHGKCEFVYVEDVLKLKEFVKFMLR